MFRRAERKNKLLRAAFVGTSGSGKTWSALELATGLGGPIAVIDTEKGSSELYADEFQFDILVISAPYTVQKYIDAIKAAGKAGYRILIIDQISHAWAGEGGLLELHDDKTKADPKKNSYTAWRDVTPLHNKFIEEMLNYPGHLIANMRAKVAYELVDNGRGGKKPVKLGLAPVQREGMDYEFDLVFDLSVEGHLATSSKDRTRLFDEKPTKPSQETGRQLLAWLNSGKACAPDSATDTPHAKPADSGATGQKPQGQSPGQGKPPAQNPGAGQNANQKPPAQGQGSGQNKPPAQGQGSNPQNPRTIPQAQKAIWSKLLAEVGNDPEKAAIRLSELAEGVCRVGDLTEQATRDVWRKLYRPKEQGK